jgi:hypothetical protein
MTAAECSAVLVEAVGYMALSDTVLAVAVFAAGFLSGRKL